MNVKFTSHLQGIWPTLSFNLLMLSWRRGYGRTWAIAILMWIGCSTWCMAAGSTTMRKRWSMQTRLISRALVRKLEATSTAALIYLRVCAYTDQKAPPWCGAFPYLFSPPGAVATFYFHPSPLSIDSLNLFENAVTWFNTSGELDHN